MKEDFIYFMKRFQNWMMEALESLKLIYCNLAISCNFFSTNLEKIESINFYIFPCNSNENQATKK